MKTCKRCLEKKALSEFCKDSRARGERTARGGMGVEAVCKICKAEQRKPGIFAKREKIMALRKSGFKRCNLCCCELPVSSFSRRAASKDGLNFTCRPCAAERCRTWRESNPGAFQEWYGVNKVDRAQYWKDWYERNRAHRSDSYAAWASRNKHIVRALIAKRHAKKLRATPLWADRDVIRSIYEEAVLLTETTGIKYEVDHIYPLQGKRVCGLHCEANLQILTKLENLRKHNRMPEDVK